jgi:hypothetical protein
LRNILDFKDLCASIDTIAPLILVTIDDPFYKIAAEALTVSQALIRAIRPEFCENLDYNTLAESIYKVVFSKLKISDIDQVYNFHI